MPTMRREYVYESHDLVDAGAMLYNVEAHCPQCGHRAVLQAIDLWWLFEQRGWSDTIAAVTARLRCSPCKAAGRARTRPAVALVHRQATLALPHVPDRIWKRAVRRRR